MQKKNSLNREIVLSSDQGISINILVPKTAVDRIRQKAKTCDMTLARYVRSFILTAVENDRLPTFEAKLVVKEVETA